ncbi:hypothetical protein AYO44_06100 [Planctomycetaceae bacterium SCGC AG-212-F19]|nr:hypothetical protein AYO44_06100 [Planctomycetaceae bacterium SCGC AG-212-F19]
MTVASVPSFVDCLRRGNLLKTDQLGELSAALHKRFAEPRELAAELVRRGWLTPYQANQVLTGHAQDLVLGSYVLLERLGEGGMGEVFKARQVKLERIVALKVIRKDRLAHPDAIRRFQREIRAASKLSHPHIVGAIDADQVGDAHFLVMEFVEGTDLAHLVRKSGPLPIPQACDCIRQAALGLQHAFERGMVHRDIKPANLILAKAQGGTSLGVLKVLDLGLARWRSDEDSCSKGLTRDGHVLGTVDYVAPEQAMDSHTVDIRADLYSLGCAFYFVLTGKLPFPGGEALEKLYRHRYEQPTPIEQLRPEVPPAVLAVVAKLMAKQPEDRYQTPAELAGALAGLLKSGAATPAPGKAASARVGITAARAGGAENLWVTNVAVVETPPATPPSRRPKQRRALRRGVAALGLLLACAFGGFVWYAAKEPSRPSVPLALRPPSATTAIRASTPATADPTPLTPAPTTRRTETPPTSPTSTSGDLLKGREVRRFTGHAYAVNCVALSPDGKHALSASDDKTVRLWDVQTGKEVRQFTGHIAAVHHVAFSPDGKRALTASGTWNSGDNTVRLWDVATGKELKRFDGPDALVSRALFLPDPARGVSSCFDGTVRLWDLELGRPLQVFRIEPKGYITGMALLADGTQALLACADKTIRLMDLQTGAERGRLTGHRDRVNDVAIAGDGKRAVSGGADFTIRLWDLTNRTELRSITEHTGAVNRVGFFKDGKRIVSASADLTIRIWDADTGKELLRCQGHRERVRCVVATADERQLLSAGEDRTLILWDVSR